MTTSSQQLPLSSYYARISGQVHMRKQVSPVKYTANADPDAYYVDADFEIYASKEAFENKFNMVEKRRISVVQFEAFTDNVYELVYEEFKKGLTDYVDDV